MDARLHPPAALGVNLGDAHIIRNAGGSARDAIRSLTISQQLLGTEEIVIIKHTGAPQLPPYVSPSISDTVIDCGMLTFTNDDIHAVVEKNLGPSAAKDKKDYLPFPDLDQAIREDVEFLKNSPLISEKAKQSISGFVYHVESGRIRRVV